MKTRNIVFLFLSIGVLLSGASANAGEDNRVSQIQAFLNEPDPTLKIRAAYLVAEMGYLGYLDNLGDFREELPPRVVEQLIPLIEHEEATIRCAALAILGGLGDSRALEPIIENFNNHRSEQNYWQFSTIKGFSSLAALRGFRETRALNFLINIIDDQSSPRLHRIEALYSLGKSGNPSAAQRIASALREHELSNYAAEAAQLLAERTKLTESRDVLVEQLIMALENDLRPQTRYYASLALAEIQYLGENFTRALNALRRVVSDPNADQGVWKALITIRR